MFQQLAKAIKMEAGYAIMRARDPKAFASRSRDHFAEWYSRLPFDLQ